MNREIAQIDSRLQKQNGHALRESEEEFRTLFNRIPAALYRTSSDGWILSANPALVDLLGYPDFESLAKVNVSDMYVDPEDRARSSEILARDGVVHDSIFRVRRLDGRVIWVSDFCQLVKDEDGRVIFHEGSLEDITERMLAETALKESEDRYRLLADSTPDYIFSLDREGRLSAVNESISRGSGLAPDALIGRGLEVFGLPQAEIDQLRAVIEHVFVSGDVVQTEITTSQSNGNSLALELVLRPIRDPTGEITGIHGVCRDVTGIRNTEQELRKVNRALKVLSECNQAVMRAEDEGALLDEVSRIIVEDGDFRFAWVGYVDEVDARSPIRPIASAGRGAGYLEWVANGRRGGEEDASPARRAVDTGEPAVVKDIRAEPDGASWRSAAVRGGFRSAIGLPLADNGRTFGALVLYAGETDAFDAEEVELLQDLASDLAYGILALRLRVQHEQAEARVHRQLRSLAALREIDLAITSSQDLQVIFDVLLDKVVAELNVDAACVLLMRPHTQALEFTAGRGFRTHALKHTLLRLGDGYAGKAALERQMIRIPDLRNCDSDFVRSPDFSTEGFVAYYAFPLIAKGQVKGVMELFQRERHDPDRDWLDFLETLAGQAAIALDNADLFSELQSSNAELTLAYDTTIEGWSRALDLRDRETEGHTRRVMRITLRLAKKMGISDAEMVHIRRGALLHDIGKMGIPDSILLKPDKLTDEEWAIMRNHPVYAYKMLSPIDYLRPALEIPYCHHEKWDGTGYPRGLKGGQIPLAARIFAVADVWDALRSDRPYRKAWTNEKALEYIRNQAGRHFDPAVVAVFFEEELHAWQPE